jgi:hypothetical protein
VWTPAERFKPSIGIIVRRVHADVIALAEVPDAFGFGNKPSFRRELLTPNSPIPTPKEIGGPIFTITYRFGMTLALSMAEVNMQWAKRVQTKAV